MGRETGGFCPGIDGQEKLITAAKGFGRCYETVLWGRLSLTSCLLNIAELQRLQPLELQKIEQARLSARVGP